MSQHSVAEAKNQLSRLIDRALEGESVVITRHGHAVVELRPVRRVPGPVTKEAIEWLRRRRGKRLRTTVDAPTLIRQMRDEGW